jgi:hypothetical protein
VTRATKAKEVVVEGSVEQQQSGSRDAPEKAEETNHVVNAGEKVTTRSRAVEHRAGERRTGPTTRTMKKALAAAHPILSSSDGPASMNQPGSAFVPKPIAAGIPPSQCLAPLRVGTSHLADTDGKKRRNRNTPGGTVTKSDGQVGASTVAETKIKWIINLKKGTVEPSS